MIKEDHLRSYLNQKTEFQYICQALDNHAIHRIIRCGSLFLPSNSPVIACLTTTTELAITTEKAKPKPSLSPKHTPYILVFLKEATDHIPPSLPYNHEMNLNETFKPKIGKVLLRFVTDTSSFISFLLVQPLCLLFLLDTSITSIVGLHVVISVLVYPLTSPYVSPLGSPFSPSLHI